MGYIKPKEFPNVSVPHVVLSPYEATILKKTSPQTFTYVQKFDNEPSNPWPFSFYLPLKVNDVPMQNVLQKYYNQSPEIISLISERIRETLGKKQYYKYDAVPQKESVSFDVPAKDGEMLYEAAKQIGIELPVSVKQNVATLPLYVGKTRISRVLLKIQRKFKYYPKILEAVENAMNNFILAPKVVEWNLIVSAEPQDIKNMSTSKGWTSCISEGHCNYYSVDAAVSTRDMVAYAVSPPKYDNWVSRVWLRSNGKGAWWPENKVYSTGALDDESFLNAVTNYLKSKNILGNKGDYHPEAGGWSDSLEDFLENKSRKIKDVTLLPKEEWINEIEKTYKIFPVVHQNYSASIQNLVRDIENTVFNHFGNFISDSKLFYDYFQIKTKPHVVEQIMQLNLPIKPIAL